MTIKVKWLIENRVMLSKFSGEIDSEQIVDYLDISLAMRDVANETNGKNGFLVHTITDGIQITKQSSDLGTLRKIMTSLKQQRVGWSLYVSDKRIDRFLSSMAHQFGGIRYQSFETMDDAIAFLRENDTSLRDAFTPSLDFTFPDE